MCQFMQKGLTDLVVFVTFWLLTTGSLPRAACAERASVSKPW